MEPRQQNVTTYRVRTGFTAFTLHTHGDRDETTPVVIPVGSTIEWHLGDYNGGMAAVYWLRRRVLVMESELLKFCDRIAEGPSTYTLTSES
jgi:hypothetical protein